MTDFTKITTDELYNLQRASIESVKAARAAVQSTLEAEGFRRYGNSLAQDAASDALDAARANLFRIVQEVTRRYGEA